MQPSFYIPFHTPFGACSMVWRESSAGPRVQRIFLPSEKMWIKKMVRAAFPDVQPGITPVMEELVGRIREFLKGKALDFDLNRAALENCSEFQQKVLKAEYAIPRGWVSTYDRLAEKVFRVAPVPWAGPWPPTRFPLSFPAIAPSNPTAGSAVIKAG